MPRDIHILLVNNAPEVRQMLRTALAEAGYGNITEASCGLSASKILRSTPLDLIITDIEITALDGWRLARLIRSGVFHCSSATPIIVVAKTWCERIAETTAREFGVNEMIALEHFQTLPEVVQSCLQAPAEIFRNPSVLVVEDTQDTADLVLRVLRHRFDVEVAGDGRSGLEAWKKGRHDLVLLDTMLPGMSGPEVLQAIMEIDPEQPVVIMTAFSSVDLAEDLMLKGAADFIAKPFRAEQLRKVCELAVKRDDYLVSNAQFAARVESVRESTEAYRRVSEAHQRLLDNLSTIVLELDAGGRIRFVNQAWNRLTGFSVAESLEKPLISFMAHDKGSGRNGLKSLLTRESVSFQGELRLNDKQGQTHWVECRMDAINSDEGPAIFGCLDDISERKKAQSQLEFLTMHDHLTGLYNRHYFDGALRRMVATSSRGQGSHALLYIDIDHFKVINDTFGHQRGDALLREISELILSRLRRSDVLCRLGGDEYAILAPNSDPSQAKVIAEEICQLLQNFRSQIDGKQVGLSCSIGISEIHGLAVSPEEYLKQADIALYVAKRRGRNRVQVYDPKDTESEELRNSLDWARRLRQAIEEDWLQIHFQPIMHIGSGKIAHYEALVRLDLPGRELVFPGEFIPALELAGEMPLLDHAVIRQTIALVAANPGLGRVAINLSAQAFRDEQLAPLIEGQLRLKDVAPSRIMFELTESASISNITAAQRMIKRLNGIGCEFAVDDFGTGFSTFGFLKLFPAEFVKVDGSFISNLDRNPVDQVLVRSISEVAKALKKKTIAEFVHSETVLNLVKGLGIDYAQGYHIGPPLPIGELKLTASAEAYAAGNPNPAT
ncbi:hypothetical protein DESUT3_14450 [Desulfuromonas versatilis]|uniref:Response regulator receiver modulated diguanylate cyclase/phosphodiesterase with PAS/PAC sensor(S) n=1 Tax=Desulfuromonas versatilis TaxID=2802975 RepID=A0ABN6DZ29_9BACT|nr:EAL domain-containing protein [Desulfuromonas versatilis]BCR04376.1 hypothetical protein DESUT3_14450 [Desulfuromonas versatilis]